MTPLIDLLWLMVGFVGVTIGADIFVEGASKIAQRLGISPLLVGLTIVALGTSAPEVAVNVTAATRGQTDMAIGNVIGSNILNVLGVLGLSALLRAIVVDAQLVRLDVPVMIGSALLLGALGWDGRITGGEAALLFLILVVYTGVQISLALRERRSTDEEPDTSDDRSLWWRIGQIALGVVLLVLGSDSLVYGATNLARWWGLSELVHRPYGHCRRNIVAGDRNFARRDSPRRRGTGRRQRCRLQHLQHARRGRSHWHDRARWTAGE